MKPWRRALVAALAIAMIAIVARRGRAVGSTPPALLDDLLHGIDLVPSHALYDPTLGNDPVPTLMAIAMPASGTADVGARVRAIRALSLYSDDSVRASLTTLITTLTPSTVVSDIILLNSSIESLGLCGQATDVPTIEPLLNYDNSRDIRATAARALRDIGSTTAIDALRTRYAIETTAEVRLAISEALRQLGQTP